MKLRIVAFGKCRSPSIKELASDYLERINRYIPTEIVEIEPGRRNRAQRLRKLVSARDHVVALDEKGRAFSSPGFARRLQRLLMDHEKIVFLVGEAEGLPAGAAEPVDEKLSLSPMTFQHDLARVLLLEQLYRALSILKGEPYHK